MKKLICMLITVSMLLSCIPMALAENTEQADGNAAAETVTDPAGDAAADDKADDTAGDAAAEETPADTSTDTAGDTAAEETPAPEETQPSMPEAQKTADKLYALGILNKDLWAAYSPEGEMSRAQFAYLAASIMGFDSENAVVDTKQHFIDVTADDEYASSIGYLFMAGIVNGDGSGAFNPDRSITYAEAVKICVALLGYDILAMENGGFQQGYLGFASSTGLIGGVNGSLDTPITQKNIIKLLDNLLDIPMMTLESYVNGQVQIGNDKNKTILKQNLGLETYEGILNAYEYTSLKNDVDEIGDQMVEINNQRFWVTDDSASGLIGQYVIAYYGNDDDTIVYMEADERRNEVLSIDARDLEDSTSIMSVAYRNKSDAVKYANMESDAVFIYNGKKLNTVEDTDLLPDEGSVTLVDHDKNGRYDVALIESYEVVVVDGVVATDNIIKLKYGMGSLDVSEGADAHVSYYLNGDPATISDVSRWSVLSLKRSKNLQGTVLYEIHISNDNLQTQITSQGEKNGEYIVTVEDGTQYALSRSYVQRVEAGSTDSSYPVLGKMLTVYFDKFGKIAAVDTLAGAKNYGYVTKCYYDEETDEVFIRIFTKDAEFINFDVKEKLWINDNRVDRSELPDALRASSGTGDVCQLIVYTANEENLLTKVQTAVDKTAEEDKLYVAKPEEFVLNAHPINATTGDPGGMRFYKYLADNRPLYFLEGSTIHFQIPTDKDAEDQYKIATKLAGTDVSLGGPVYAYDAGNGGLLGAVVSNTTNDGDFSLPMVVDRIQTAVDEDNEICTEIVFADGSTAMTKGDQVIYSQPEKALNGEALNWSDLVDYSDVRVTDLKRGDVIQYTLSNGKIEMLRVLVRIDDIGPVRIDGDYMAENGNMICEVYSVSDNKRTAVVRYVDYSGNERYQSMFINGSVYKVDKAANEVTYSSSSDIEPGDTLLISSFWWSAKVVIIFR